MSPSDDRPGGTRGAGTDLPTISAFGEALVAATRQREELPSLDAFGERLVTRARTPRRRLRTVVLGLAVALPLAASSGVATAVVLRETVAQAPDPASVPDEQTPLAGTAVVSPLRARDPGKERPWTIRVARSKTGFTCTTVGQVQDGTFGLTGLDGVFRRLPGELSDACGQGGTLTGARIVAGDRLQDVRSIVYGVAPGLRSATLITATGRRVLDIGPGGTFVAALRGYPEDHTAGVTLTFANRTEHHDFGADGTIPDPGGAQAWAVERYTLGTRQQCSHVRQARRGAGVGVTSDDGPPFPVGPTTCLGLRTSDRAWVADARVLHPGDRGTPGFDRWGWRDTPARTVVWGIARTGKTIKRVMLHGAGAPRELAITREGAFAAVLPAAVAPGALSLRVTLADGTVQDGRPGDGIVPDLVKSRRPR